MIRSITKAKIKYFDKCDKIFAYIHKDEGEDDEIGSSDNANSIYY